MVVRVPVKRLEQALCDWEQKCFVAQVNFLIAKGMGIPGASGLPYSGPIRHWRSFRRYLLNSYGRQDFDASLYVGDSEVEKILKSSNVFPASLYSWTTFSRRDYHLSKDMQEALKRIPLDNITWGEVEWPYNSFGLSLEDPIVGLDGRTYDFILLTIFNSVHGGFVEVRIFPTDLERMLVFPEIERQRISRLVEGRKFRTAANLFTNLLNTDEVITAPTTAYWTQHNPENVPLVNVLEPIPEKFNLEDQKVMPEISEAVRLLVGFCYFLDELPPSLARYDDLPVDRPSTQDPTNVTYEGGVCYLAHRNTLVTSSSFSTGERSGKYEMPTHWRRAHKRRPIGEGRNPYAKRTVRIPPTLIRWDRLVKGAIPGGNQTIVKAL